MTNPKLLNGEAEPAESNDAVLDAIDRLELRIQKLESQIANVKKDAVIMVLNLFTAALRDIAAGKFDISALPAATDSNSKWDEIKKRMPPRHQEAVDILLLTRKNRTQLAAAMEMRYNTCATHVIAPLIKQGWVIESAGLLSLKEL